MDSDQVAASRVLDEIYIYRARVAEYSPRFSNRLAIGGKDEQVAESARAYRYYSVRTVTAA